METAYERFEVPLKIQSEDIDVLGHVNNVVYLRWVQEAAIAHWTAAATEEEQRTLIWVVVRHEIDYKRAALAGDDILAHTWVGRAGRRAFDRHTEILRVADGKVLAAARTVWCPLDPETFRPTDVSEAVRARFSVPDGREA